MRQRNMEWDKLGGFNEEIMKLLDEEYEGKIRIRIQREKQHHIFEHTFRVSFIISANCALWNYLNCSTALFVTLWNKELNYSSVS